jgi:hypothetical protein
MAPSSPLWVSVNMLATGADHLYEYTATGFSTIPTIGALFLLNFIAAEIVGAGLLLPLRRMTQRFGDPVRTLLALSGIGITASSLIALWISESSSLFGFTDYGFRVTIVVAIVAESTAIMALTAYLALAGVRMDVPRTHLRSASTSVRSQTAAGRSWCEPCHFTLTFPYVTLLPRERGSLSRRPSRRTRVRSSFST